MRNQGSLLTAAQLAQELGVSRWTVYQWVKFHKIPFYRAGPTKLLFSLKAVLRQIGGGK